MWISWNDVKVDIQYVHSTDKEIHCEIYDNHGIFKLWITTIYGHNHLEQRSILWNTIKNLKTSIQGPWCILGNFNNVMNAQDRIGGRMVTEVEYKDLHEMMSRVGLSEMDIIADHFTWNKNIAHGISTQECIE